MQVLYYKMVLVLSVIVPLTAYNAASFIAVIANIVLGRQ